MTQTDYGSGLVNGNGFQLGGVDPGPGSNFNDNGAVVQTLRVNGRAGAIHYNYGESGSVAGNTMAMYDRAIADGVVPGMIFIGIGTNDAASERPAGQVLQFLRDLRQRVGPLIRIIVREIPSLAIDPTFDSPTFEAEVARVNAEIKTFTDETDSATFVAVFDSFGGLTPTPALFQNNNIHPNEAGSKLLGDLVGAAI